MKIDHGMSARSVRQWKKDVKARYSAFTAHKERLAKFLNNRQEEIDEEMERKRLEAKREQQREEEHRPSELRLRQEEHERRMWQEKFEAELEATHRRLELEKGEVGSKVAWERLKAEYGQDKLVVNAHVEEIINLPIVKGFNYLKVQEFYEIVSQNHDALLTLREADILRGVVMSTLNKLPHVQPRSQGPLSTSRKYPGCGWSRVC